MFLLILAQGSGVIFGILFIIIYNIFIHVSGIDYQELIGHEYCDSLEINNNWGNVEDTEIRNESNIEDEGGSHPSLGEENSNILSFKDKVKCRLHWVMWAKYKDKSVTYKDFKESWNPNQSIRHEIKKDIKVRKENIRLQKRTLKWFLNIRKSSRYGNRSSQNDNQR